MSVGRWGTVAEAAQWFGLSRQRIHQLIRNGSLGETRRFKTPRGPVWMIRQPFARTTKPSGYHRGDCVCGKHHGDGGTK